MVAELRLQLHLRRRHLQQDPLGEGGRHRPALQRRRTRLYGPLEEPGRPVALPRHQGAAFDDPAQLGAFRGAAQRTMAFERDAHLRVPAEIPQTARIQASVGVSDIVRFSTVKYERGTSYPYCRTINLTFRPTF